MSEIRKCGSCGLPFTKHPHLGMTCYLRKQAEDKVEELTKEVETLTARIKELESKSCLDLEVFAKERGINLDDCKGDGHWIP